MSQFFKCAPTPPASSVGVVTSPLMGETEIGRIYEVDDPTVISALHRDPHWQAVEQAEFEAQERAHAES